MEYLCLMYVVFLFEARPKIITIDLISPFDNLIDELCVAGVSLNRIKSECIEGLSGD